MTDATILIHANASRIEAPLRVNNATFSSGTYLFAI